MDDTLNQQDNIPEDSTYVTPYNVDLFSPKPKNYFTEYTRTVLSLPEPIRNILMDSATAEFIEENLGPSFGLNKGQKTEITRIIRDILLGDISINQMASKISEKLEIDPTVSYQIQSKIVSELFGSAIEDIKKIQKELLPQKPPPTPAQPREQYPKPAQPKYTPPQPPQPPTRNQDSSISPSNVVDLRNQK